MRKRVHGTPTSSVLISYSIPSFIRRSGEPTLPLPPKMTGEDSKYKKFQSVPNLKVLGGEGIV